MGSVHTIQCLPIDVIEAHNIFMFRKLLKHMNRVYVDLLTDYILYVTL